MESRNLISLLVLLRKHAKYYIKHENDTGLCGCLDSLRKDNLINNHEHHNLQQYITKHMPHDYLDPVWERRNLYGWPRYDVEVREKWLDQQISIETYGPEKHELITKLMKT